MKDVERIVIRLNTKIDKHKQVYEILKTLDPQKYKAVNRFVIDCIYTAAPILLEDDFKMTNGVMVKALKEEIMSEVKDLIIKVLAGSYEPKEYVNKEVKSESEKPQEKTSETVVKKVMDWA